MLLLCAASGCDPSTSVPGAQAPAAHGAEAADGDDPPSTVRGTDQALLGGTDFDDATVKEQGITEPGCNEDDKAMFRQIMTLGRTVALGGAIRQCVRFILGVGDGTFGPYHTCAADPYAQDAVEKQIEGVLQVLATPNPVHITCTTGNIGVTRVSGRYDLPSAVPEPFDIPNPPLSQLFDPEYLAANSGASSATREETDFRARVFLIAPRSALVWHEAMHVHSYRHDCPNQTYFESVPYMVQYCLQQVAQRSVDRCDLRGGCPTGGERALIDGYPVTDQTGCECIRDAVAEGTTDIAATPILDRGEAGDRFGAAMAAGDFNGDGFADLAVGAPGEDGSMGRISLYVGSVFGLYADRILEQDEIERAEAGDEFGASLLAFDLDRDLIDDLVIGAPGEDNGTGAVYVFRGTRSGLSPRVALGSKTHAGLTPGSRFGEALAAGPFLDVTRPVLAIGTPGTEQGSTAGAVYLMTGVSNDRGLLEALATLLPAAPEGHAGDRFGAALAFGELARRPGRSALVVGAPGDQAGGAVHVVLAVMSSAMGNQPQIAPTYTLHSEAGGPERFGQSVALGRAAGPGTLLIGVPWASPGGRENSGSVQLWRAGESGAEPIQTLDGSLEGGQLGSTLLATGRWRMFDEFLASAPLGARETVHRGQSSFDNDALDYRVQWGSAPETERPAAFAHGDFDGSGTLDLVMGMPDETEPTRSPTGGFFEVYRRTDDGAWVEWGRYRQGE